MLGTLVRLLRLVSIVACAIVVLAFIVFAADRTKTASGHQQEQISAINGGGGEAAKPVKHESGIHEALDEASSTLTSPFAGIVSSASSEWAEHSVRLLLALLVYGFGLGFIARTLRVRM